MDPILPSSYGPISCFPLSSKLLEIIIPTGCLQFPVLFTLKPSPYMPTEHPHEDVKELVGYTRLGFKPEADEIHLGVIIKEMAISATRTDGPTQGARSRICVLSCLLSRGRGARPNTLREQLVGWEGKAAWFPGGWGKIKFKEKYVLTQVTYQQEIKKHEDSVVDLVCRGP